jgi:hypothetical protein
MKKKLLILAISLMGYAAANANNGWPNPDPGVDGKIDGKKDELNGIVIHAETKKPIKNVCVTAVLISKKEKTVSTDDAGGYAFDELKPGTYKFIFEKSGYRKITKEKVVIKTDEAFQLNIEMIESPDFDIIPSPFGAGGY